MMVRQTTLPGMATTHDVVLGEIVAGARTAVR